MKPRHLLCKPRVRSGRPARPHYSAMYSLALIIPLVMLLSGCFIARDSLNEPLKGGDINDLRPGVTTAKEVVGKLGAPTDVVQLGRRSAYRYDFTNRKRAGLFLLVANFINDDTRSDRLWVFFNEDEILTHAGATLNGNDATYAMPWDRLHD